ncbi:hypothetical protein DIDNDMLP_00194 [Klebsiella phage KP13-7]|nr:hypothetical protein DIDNDMLP_00194 [Klebsiella phage KP13-7]
MLVKLHFDLEKMNAEGVRNGTSYEVIDHDGKYAHIVKVDYSHSLWNGFGAEGVHDIDFLIEHQPGVYETLSANFHLEIEETQMKICDKDNITTNGEVLGYDEYEPYSTEFLPSYGVCDSIEQVLELYKPCIDHSTNKFVISLTPIYKNTQPELHGWRWHKWGEYIGTQEITTEYIADEPLIEMVYCFHIYCVEEK